MRRLSLLLVLLGIVVALYPQAQRFYYLHRHAAALERWAATALPAEEEAAPFRPEERGAVEGEGYTPEGAEPLSVLLIPAIELEIPVFLGATRSNLRRGAALLAGWALPGEAGCAVITAHRSHHYGMQFNRLDELAAGDEVLVRTREGEQRYAVTGKKIARPAEITLPRDRREGKPCLALVTCHPLYTRDPPYRLVVIAELETKE